MSTPNQAKVAIVTGASSGIGRATAITLSKAGWHVVLVARREPELNEAAKECPTSSLVMAGDATDEDFAATVFKTTVEKFGRIDVVFNNAGISASAVPLEELSVQEIRKVLDVNVMSAFIFTREAIKVFKTQTPQGGRIINNGSVSAQTPRVNAAPYAASKHATTGLTKSTSLDGRDFNITCTQIDIGNAQTHLSASHSEGILQPNGQTTVEAFIDVQHVANAVLHVANLPLDVTVLFMNIMATKMPFVGRG